MALESDKLRLYMALKDQCTDITTENPLAKRNFRSLAKGNSCTINLYQIFNF